MKNSDFWADLYKKIQNSGGKTMPQRFGCGNINKKSALLLGRVWYDCLQKRG
jgi:hypothetical protein